MRHPSLRKSCAGWKQDLSQIPGNTAGHRALLRPWQPPNPGWPVNLSPDVTGPRMVSAVNYLRKSERPETEHEWARSCSEIETPSFGDNTYFTQMAPHTKASLRRAKSQKVPYVRAAPSCGPLQLPLLLHERLVLQLAGFYLCASCIGVWSPPPTRLGGQKQSNHWPIADFAATVDNTHFTKSSRNFLQSRLNSFFT